MDSDKCPDSFEENIHRLFLCNKIKILYDENQVEIRLNSEHSLIASLFPLYFLGHKRQSLRELSCIV